PLNRTQVRNMTFKSVNNGVLMLVVALGAGSGPNIVDGKNLNGAGQAATSHFRLAAEAEVMASVNACAPGTSWGRKGAEAAILTLFLDDQYNQDIILFMGEDRFTYRVLLGRVAAGDHRVRLEINPKLGSDGVSSVMIGRISVASIERSQWLLFTALSHAPVLYARRNSIGRFTDIPLLMWYEVFDEKDSTR